MYCNLVPFPASPDGTMIPHESPSINADGGKALPAHVIDQDGELGRRKQEKALLILARMKRGMLQKSCTLLVS